MKKIVFIILGICNAAVVFAQHDMKNMPGMDKQKQAIAPKTQAITYTCPMHPEIHSSKPGNCPKCGMKLVKEKPKVEVSKPAADTKKMEIAMPKDSMQPQHNMQGMQMDAMPKTDIDKTVYTCPMHPEVKSGKPGNCPKCGMKLVKEKLKAAPGAKMDMDMPMPKEKQGDPHSMNDNKTAMKGMDMNMNKPADKTMGYKS